MRRAAADPHEDNHADKDHMTRFEEKLAECQQNNTQYIDKVFKADKNSLIKDWTREDVQSFVGSWENYDWKRPSEIECF